MPVSSWKESGLLGGPEACGRFPRGGLAILKRLDAENRRTQRIRRGGSCADVRRRLPRRAARSIAIGSLASSRKRRRRCPGSTLLSARHGDSVCKIRSEWAPDQVRGDDEIAGSNLCTTSSRKRRRRCPGSTLLPARHSVCCDRSGPRIKSGATMRLLVQTYVQTADVIPEAPQALSGIYSAARSAQRLLRSEWAPDQVRGDDEIAGSNLCTTSSRKRCRRCPGSTLLSARHSVCCDRSGPRIKSGATMRLLVQTYVQRHPGSAAGVVRDLLCCPLGTAFVCDRSGPRIKSGATMRLLVQPRTSSRKPPLSGIYSAIRSAQRLLRSEPRIKSGALECTIPEAPQALSNGIYNCFLLPARHSVCCDRSGPRTALRRSFTSPLANLYGERQALTLWRGRGANASRVRGYEYHVRHRYPSPPPSPKRRGSDPLRIQL